MHYISIHGKKFINLILYVKVYHIKNLFYFLYFIVTIVNRIEYFFLIFIIC